MEADKNVPDPQQRPVVTISGERYELKYRWRDIISLEQRNLPLSEFTPDKFSVEKLTHFLIAGIAHVAALDFDTVVNDLEVSQLPEISSAVTEAIRKARPSAKSELREPAANQQV